MPRLRQGTQPPRLGSSFVIDGLFRKPGPGRISRYLSLGPASGLLTIRSAGDSVSTLAVRLGRPQDSVIFAAYTVRAATLGTLLL